jgi:hypothetical protein
MEKIKQHIKTKSDFDNFLEILIEKVKCCEPISENPMLDGFIISFIVVNDRNVRDYILGYYLGRLLDGTIQQLEQICIWLTNNEEKIIGFLKK